MNWLTDYVKPKLSSLVSRKDPPSDLWTKCGCGERTLYVSDLKENLNVCSYCDFHMGMDVNSRLKNLFDNENYELIEVPFENNDPLKFKDLKKYTDRMKAAQKKTDQKDAAILAKGEIGSTKVVVFILDFNFMGGSMGGTVGTKFVKAVQTAIDKSLPLICFSTSGGARMQESMVSLMQMAKTAAALEKLRERSLPYFSVMIDPIFGFGFPFNFIHRFAHKV